MTNEIFSSPYYNCTELVTASLLKKKNVDINRVWKQAGLVLSKEEDGSIYLTNEYQEFTKDLSENNGINFVTESYSVNEIDKFLSKIFNNNYNDRTLSVTSNLYYLPYCRFYHKAHDVHLFEVIDVREDHLVICDHFYNYFGNLDKEEFIKSTHSIYKNTKRNINRVGYIKNKFTVDEIDLNKILTNNLNIMEGYDISKCYHSKELVVGLQAVPLIQEEFLQVFNDNIDSNRIEAILDDFHKGFKRLGNSRYRMMLFLNSFKEKELADKFLEASQPWTIIANMIGRMYFTGVQQQMEERFIQRFAHAFKAEEKAMGEIRKLVNKTHK
ncbi:hypothetical protein FHE72_01105 [Rossellomorea vietnamensis]|uniref:Butirosin biosynthesis protein H N-terminal domain-containing protein n=1 Tax=Rossellomorea vietnamensis TaxID=218284 RepID=A0A6I6UL94_9BACI|nr:hypothetical protein [Rossellomorea vietnamensis]QHE59791.1 hypothetical protein FHE72_01105 [Rossellomorea vietnamensis]